MIAYPTEKMMAWFDVVNEIDLQDDDELRRCWVTVRQNERELLKRKSVILHYGHNVLLVTWRGLPECRPDDAAIFWKKDDRQPFGVGPIRETHHIDASDGDILALRWVCNIWDWDGEVRLIKGE